nr:MAG TPA: hypothetical protein [Caudoviricetes sp.]
MSIAGVTSSTNQQVRGESDTPVTCRCRGAPSATLHRGVRGCLPTTPLS